MFEVILKLDMYLYVYALPRVGVVGVLCAILLTKKIRRDAQIIEKK